MGDGSLLKGSLPKWCLVHVRNPLLSSILVRLKAIRYMDGSNFPSNEGIVKQSTKNAHRVIENKKELVEFYADWIIQGISFTFTISILYLVYVLFEKESKEKDAQIKLLTKQKMNRIKGKIL